MCGADAPGERQGTAPGYREQRTAQNPRHITHNVIVRRSTAQLPTTFVTSLAPVVPALRVELAQLRRGGKFSS